jgi:carboxypeptidase PM20D1
MDALLRTTQAVTILRAGEKENVIPSEARAVINMRLLPGDTTLSVLEHVERIARRSVPERFSLEVRLLPGADASDPVPALTPNRELWETICGAVMAVEPRAVIAPFLVVVRTDSRRFSSIADSIVRLHPIILTSEELGRIHGVDERISMQNYARMIAFYRQVLSASARGGGQRTV